MNLKSILIMAGASLLFRACDRAFEKKRANLIGASICTLGWDIDE